MKRIVYRQDVTGARGGRVSVRAVRHPVVERRAAQQEPGQPMGMRGVRAALPVLHGLLLLLCVAPSQAQNFDSGSDGSDGAFTMNQNTTLDVPPDGIFNFTTFTTTGGTLTFRPNVLNSPVYILATGAISLSNTNIVVDGSGGTSNPPAGGKGGPGAFDGGDPGVQAIPQGDGNGPGGARGGTPSTDGTAAAGAGSAAYGAVPENPSALDGAVYGSPLLVPLVGGSGGGGTAGSGASPGLGGAGGGGAILLASNVRIGISGGGIFARGGSNGFPQTNHGSGGAIRLVAPQVGGAAQLDVNGGGGSSGVSGDRGGAGRVRIDTIDRSSISFSYGPSIAVLSVGSFMAVFPPVVPKLDLFEVAGQAIPAGAPVDVLLPFGTNPNQTVKVRATDFTGTVPIEVVLVPSSGPRTVVQSQINMNTNPAQATINVTFPVNNRTRVWAWTR